MIYDYLLRLSVTLLLTTAYYKYVKTYLIYLTPRVTSYFKLTRYFTREDINGTVELIMIAISHLLFCLLLFYILPIHFVEISLKPMDAVFYFLYGILLGVGCMGLSGLVSKIAVLCAARFKKNDQYDLKSWLTVGRGGWIKHHLQSMEILPLYLSLLVLTMQVGSEEVIFRSLLINYFLPFGQITTFITSSVLFVLMQAFLMNKWEAAIFPMIGAAVMGVVHSILYLHVPMIWPLIVAHVSFFLFSVL